MAYRWFYIQMGEELGPVSSAKLRRLAKSGEVQRDTRIRAESSESWHSADRIKGLFPPTPKPPPPPVRKPEPPAELPLGEEVEQESDTYSLRLDMSKSMLSEGNPSSGSVPSSIDIAAGDEDEWDFFHLGGFDSAIGGRLHEAVKAYNAQHGTTMSQVVRQALARFIGKPELAGEMPKQAAASQRTPSQ